MPISRPKKNTFRYATLSFLTLLIIVFLAGLTVFLSQNRQSLENRGQAAGACTEELVAVYFQKTDTAGSSWDDSAHISVKKDEKINVNCFAKTGTTLLSNPKITAKYLADGQNPETVVSIPAQYFKTAGEIRGYPVPKAGKLKFTCSNSACSASDTLTITGTAGSAATDTTSGIACGELCGGQSDGTNYPINCRTGTICGNSANGGATGNRCIPVNSLLSGSGYVQGGGICKNDKNPAVFCLNKADGTPVTTVADVRAACDKAFSTSSGGTDGGTCSLNADFDKDGKRTIKDYKAFLEDYRKGP